MGLVSCGWRSSLDISYVRTPFQEMCGVSIWDAWHLGPWWTDLDAQGLFPRCIPHASAFMMVFSSSFLGEQLNIITEFLTTCVFLGISASL